MALTPGARLGPYEITAQIGVGGMGEVYRATDTNLKRQVAIKVLPASVAGDVERLARFQREAEVLAALNHPHIAAIYGLEKAPEFTALVMELVEGDDLSQRIAKGAIPVDEALPIAKQIAEALEAAHEQGIIHRDLKPANIKVRPDGTVKVLDFGLAKALGQEVGSRQYAVGSEAASQAPTITTPAMMPFDYRSGQPEHGRGLTGVGMILGTAAYMAPEQARGKAVDKRADIWAFGAVLFEMLTEKRAFPGEDITDTLAAVVRAEPEWTRLPAGLSPALVTYLKRCLHKDPKQRIPDIAAMRLALEGAFETTVVPQVVDSSIALRPLWRRALPVAAAVVVTAAIVAGAAWSVVPPPEPPDAIAQFTIQPPEGQALSEATRQSIAISADGRRILFSASNRLFVRSIGEVEATPIAGIPEGMVANSPVFSPDGESVLFQTNRDGTLKRVPVAGGPPQTVAQGFTNPTGMTWGPDGIVFANAGQGVFRVSPNGGMPERLAQVETGEAAFGPQILPGGEFVMFTLAKGNGQPDRWDTAQIVVQSLVSGDRRTIIRNGSDARYLPTGLGSPKRAEREGGHIVYAAAGTLYAVAFDLAALTVRGDPVPVVAGVRRALNGVTGAAFFSVSSNGSLVYVPGPLTSGGANLVPTLVDRTGKRVALPIPPKAYTRPRISPNGSRLAMGVDESGAADIWVYELSGTAAVRRLTFGGRNRFPVWSSDGRRVAFQSDRDGRPAIYAQPADGGGGAERLTDPVQGTSHVPESWSPDGKTLLFSEEKGGTYALMALSVADKQAMPIAGVEGREPPEAVFSPDGRWISFNINKGAGGAPSPDRGIFVQPFPPTGAMYQVPKSLFDFHPAWGPSGREVFYVPSVAAVDLVAVSVQIGTSPSFGTPIPVSGVPQPGVTSVGYRAYDVLPDGRFLALLPEESGLAGAQSELRVVLNWFTELKRLVPTQ